MRPRVAVVGTFDVDNYGDHLFPRIAVRELSRRLPGAVVDVYAPFGPRHPTRFSTGGPAVRELGPWIDERLDRFAATYDGLVIGGGELLHLNDPLLSAFYGVEPSELEELAPSRWFLEGLGGPVREERCPVLWHAIGVPFDLDPAQAARVRSALEHRASCVVRDRRSRERLLAAGVTTEVTVVPDSGLLVDRILDPLDLAARRRRLGIPDATLVVQGCDLLVPAAGAITAAVARVADAERLDVTLVETGRCRGDDQFADAVSAALGERPHRRVPPDASLEDVAAVVSSAALFVGSSLHGAITALVHRRPFVLVNLGDESKLRGFVELVGLETHLVEEPSRIEEAARRARRLPLDPDLVAGLQADVDRHFDALAAAIAIGVDRRRPMARWLAGRRRP